MDVSLLSCREDQALISQVLSGPGPACLPAASVPAVFIPPPGTSWGLGHFSPCHLPEDTCPISELGGCGPAPPLTVISGVLDSFEHTGT
jgi:hypothetical protein